MLLSMTQHVMLDDHNKTVFLYFNFHSKLIVHIDIPG